MTWERRLLSRRAGLREQLMRDPEFIEFRNSLPLVNVDGEEFRVIHGDRLVDDDQLIVEWANRFRPQVLGGTDVKSEPEDST